MIALFRPYRRQIAALLALVFVQSAVGVAAPFFLRAILDDALPHRDAGLASLLALGMIVSSVSAGALGVGTSQLATVIGQHVMHDLRVDVYEHLQRMSLAFFTRTHTGELLSRVVNDIGGVDNVLTNTATSTVQNVTTGLAVVVAMLILDWRLSVAALLVVPLFLAVTFRLGRQLRTIAKRRQGGLAALTTLMEESLSVAGVLLAKTMGFQPELRQRFAARSREISDLEVATAKAGRWRFASRRMALTIVPAIVYWLAAVEVSQGASLASLGTVVAFASMVNRLIGPVSGMQGIGQTGVDIDGAVRADLRGHRPAG